MQLDENGFALDAFREVGPGKHFLGSAHTMRNYETAFFDIELADNNSFEQWQEQGSHDIVWRARRQWKSLLAAYEPPALGAGKGRGAAGRLSRGRKASMPDITGLQGPAKGSLTSDKCRGMVVRRLGDTGGAYGLSDDCA